MNRLHAVSFTFSRIYVLIRHVLFCFFFPVCIVSCGIEDFVYLEPVPSCSSPISPSNASTTTENDWIFTFTPADNANSGDINYKGTEVVYRIYKSYSKCHSDWNAISSQNQNVSTQANIYSYLTTTKHFSRLCIIPTVNNLSSIETGQPLFKAEPRNSNRTIRIRFVTYNDIGDVNNKSGIYITNIAGTSVWCGLPARNPDAVSTSVTTKTFYDFTESPDTSADVDSTAKTAGDDPSSYWYVTAWALSYGVKTDYSPVYSSATYLGTVPLVKGDD